MVSIILNKGIAYNAQKMKKKLKDVVYDVFVSDQVMMYHWIYMLFCLLGWLGHEFLYCVLVSMGDNSVGGEFLYCVLGDNSVGGEFLYCVYTGKYG